MQKLEKITYICLIAVCLVSLYLLLENRFFPPALAGQPSESSLVGHREASVSEDSWKNSNLNLVLFLNTQCHFCAESVPLYQKLVGIRQQGRNMSLFVASIEAPEKMRAYLVQKNISADNVLQTTGGFAGVNLTPAIFLVDSHGVIRKAFIGKLAWIRERQLLIALNSSGT